MEFRDGEVEAYGAPPVGAVVAYAGPVDENFTGGDRWKLCDGAELPRDEYEALWGLLKDTYGGRLDANGREFFNLPDYRGYFLRGADNGAGVDRGVVERVSPTNASTLSAGVGSVQGESFASHKHGVQGGLENRPFSSTARNQSEHKGGFAEGALFADSGMSGVSRDAGHVKVKITEEPKGGSETRPVNISVNWIIKCKGG